MHVKTLIDGNLRCRVAEDTTVFRLNKGTWEICPEIHQHDGIIVTLIDDNGRHVSQYVHRLVAKAFVPNPDNLPLVDCVDGDRFNVAPDNLEWMSHSAFTQRLYDTGKIDRLKSATPCPRCGVPTIARRNPHCTDCQRHIKSEATAARRMAAIDESLGDIDLSILTKTQRRYITLRLEGLTNQAIADRLGVSKQAVHKTIQAAVKRATGRDHLFNQALKNA